MNLKCVHCDGDAEYLVKGTSYCKEHLPAEQKSEKLPADWDLNTLKSEVNRAVKEGCASLIKFDSKNKGECTIIQKLAELNLSDFAIRLTFVISLIGFGFGAISISSFAAPYTEIVNFFGYGAIWVGDVVLFYTIFYEIKNRKTFNEIILKAENRIQELNKDYEK